MTQQLKRFYYIVGVLELVVELYDDTTRSVVVNLSSPLMLFFAKRTIIVAVMANNETKRMFVSVV